MSEFLKNTTSVTTVVSIECGGEDWCGRRAGCGLLPFSLFLLSFPLFLLYCADFMAKLRPAEPTTSARPYCCPAGLAAYCWHFCVNGRRASLWWNALVCAALVLNCYCNLSKIYLYLSLCNLSCKLQHRSCLPGSSLQIAHRCLRCQLSARGITRSAGGQGVWLSEKMRRSREREPFVILTSKEAFLMFF